MPKYISLLRGINVGGKRSIKMAELTSFYQKLEYHNVTTYLQSGNVVFETMQTNTSAIQQQITSGIAQHWGYDVPVMVYPALAWPKIIADNPFSSIPNFEDTNLYVSFFEKMVQMPDLTKILKNKDEAEEIIFRENLAYLYCPIGYGKTKLNNTFLEKILNTHVTTRNWRTITELEKI